ncbi:MAG TPA: thioredoxin domain-containing protein [Chloroflexota bacterium]|nr:thioredoxin domain-containing protein [Chloroflexota bacterium]
MSTPPAPDDHAAAPAGEPAAEPAGRRANRLIAETSPYLLQHAHNPVDWYPWGDEALERARREDKPILLSVGYSACHWCHVMERESFEDEATARQMNEQFVSIKVDREERPDVDAIYMEAVQALTRHGGWPMTVFLLPDGTPFFGGTYYPNTPRHGMASFRQVLSGVADAYRNRREDVLRGAGQLRDLLQQTPRLQGQGALTVEVLAAAEQAYGADFDATNGGFGGAPKFPQPMNLEALLRLWRRSGRDATLHSVRLTLDKMARGGMYDQLGGGFHRYSVDDVWLVPHFEKMLYDNAQLATVYLQAYQVTGDGFYRRICTETLDYVLREMTAPEGGFYSAQDADSEGEEGKFFLWTPAEVAGLLGEEDARLFGAYFDVLPGGNFEGRSILHTPHPVEAVARAAGVPETRLEEAIARGRRLLFAARGERVPPGRDDKVLTAWNGLALRALARAGAALGREDYLAAARRNAAFVLGHLRAPGADWRLLRSYKDGQARFNAYLEDYAFYADGLLALYEATFDPRWLAAAQGLAATITAQFADDENGGFFDTSADHEALLTRPKDLYDNATPAGSSVAAEVLLRLDALGGAGAGRERAERFLAALTGAMAQHPGAFGRLLCALDFAVGPVKEVAIVGDPEAAPTRALRAVLFEPYRPNLVAALAPAPGAAGETPAVALLEGRVAVDGRPTAYVCEHFACRLPVTDAAALRAQLDA